MAQNAVHSRKKNLNKNFISYSILKCIKKNNEQPKWNARELIKKSIRDEVLFRISQIIFLYLLCALI